ncbi:hypothetical protein NRK68_21670 [Streptomyces yangpuensis]|uniref:DUF3558 domain-containing protein n=1 Tax=Streptomyces yangpuensis TaxID=1648182 RepID=A0ABY5Q055_9ACTN|nr:hypothetical protein [Streptomyces yangpuensis]UUY49600.1 hypothetical protein NRK68_21670 [Streptomyces yangpuensis]
MISDPELDGTGETRPAQPAERTQEPPPRGREADGAEARRPWLWALGGAALASAVWAGGLYARGDRLAAPQVSYRATENLCQDFEARALSRIAGGLHRYRPQNRQDDHPAVHRAICSLQNGESVSTLTVRVQVDLHRKTDPGPEFDVPSDLFFAEPDAVRTQEVRGLGERALLSSGLRDGTVELRVLRGGAVFTVVVIGTGSEPKTPADTAALRAAMVEDARELMTALKEQGAG